MKFCFLVLILFEFCEAKSYSNDFCATCICEADGVVTCKEKQIDSLDDIFPLPSETKSFDVSRNGLEDLSSTYDLPSSLEQLYFGRNRIQTIQRDFFFGLEFLVTLDLSYNDLEFLDVQVFRGLNSLENLDLSHNRIRALTSDWFINTPNLFRLDVGFNPLGEFSHNEPLQDTIFDSLRRLQYLDLSNCSLSFMPLDVFSNNSYLTELRLAKNPLTQIPLTQIYAVRQTLEYLDLTGIELKEIPAHSFHGLDGLKTLLLNEFPYLEAVEPLAFHGLTSLETLQCQDNPHLRFIDPFAFRDDLQTDQLNAPVNVYLSNNDLSFISKDLLPWDELETLSLEGNRWHCNCDLAWMVDVELIDDFVICASPENLENVAVNSLSESEFNCMDESSFKWITVGLFLIILKIFVCMIGYSVYKIIRNWRRSKGKRDLVELLRASLRMRNSEPDYQRLNRRGTQL